MTATEKLRQLLDERGVEWHKPSKDSERWTHWHDMKGTLFTASEDARGCVWIGASLTPEQAVEATLGRRACQRVYYNGTKNYVCSACGSGMPRGLDRYCFLNYCPNCGAKVVEQ